MPDERTTRLVRDAPRLRLEHVLLAALAGGALLAGGGLYLLKRQHDRQAHLAATEKVLEEGVALLDALCALGLTCSTNATPELWRQVSSAAEHVFAVRKDLQSLSVTRDGVTVFHRQAGAGAGPAAAPPHPGAGEAELSQRTLVVEGSRQPVFVVSRELRLPDGGRAVTEATLKREAVGSEELTARRLVSSLFALSVAVLTLSFAACALVLVAALARDRRRERRARQEEHLAFSGVLANGILHDFRNPMSAVRLDAQMLGREVARPEGFRPERVADLAGRIARTMGRMDKVFQEFLFLAKPADERPEAVDVEQAVRECADTLAPRVEQAGVALETERRGPLPPAAAYPFALRRALLNVLVNALQAAPRGSAVTVALAAAGGKVALEVLDRGPGIPAALRGRLFEMFASGRPEGTGLGLFLARTAVRRCGGEIEALPRPGGGTAVRITLPAATAPAPDARPSTPTTPNPNGDPHGNTQPADH